MRKLHLRVVRLTVTTVTAFSQALGVVYCPKNMPSNNEMAAKQLRMLNATLSILRVSSTSLTLVQKSAAVSKQLAGILVNIADGDEGAELFAVLLTQTFQWAPDTLSEDDWDDAYNYLGADIVFGSNDKLKDLIVSLETLQTGYKVLADRPLSAAEAIKATEAEKRRVQAAELRKHADDLCAEAEKIASGVPCEDEAEHKDYEDTDARALLASIREKKRKADPTAAQTQAAQKELELMLGNTQQLAAAAPSGNSTLSGTSLWSAPERASASKQTFAQIEEGKIVAKPSVRMSERDWAEQTRQWADRNFGEDRAGRVARRQYESYVDAMYRQIPVYGWQAVHDFDMDMRRDVAIGKYEGWDEYKMQVIFWTRYPMLTPQAHGASESGPGKGGAGKAKGKNKSVACRDWNRGNCSRAAGSCRFAHKCSTCGGDHKVANCTRGSGRPPPPTGAPAPNT